MKAALVVLLLTACAKPKIIHLEDGTRCAFYEDAEASTLACEWQCRE